MRLSTSLASTVTVTLTLLSCNASTFVSTNFPPSFAYRTIRAARNRIWPNRTARPYIGPNAHQEGIIAHMTKLCQPNTHFHMERLRLRTGAGQLAAWFSINSLGSYNRVQKDFRLSSKTKSPPTWAFSATDAESKTCAYRSPSVLLLCVRCFSSSKVCGRGGIGRRARFRFWWATPVKVQVLSPAPAGGRVLFLHPSPSFFLRSFYI